MSEVLQWIVVVLLVAPGIALRRFPGETPIQWLGLRVLLSIGGNGLVFFGLRASGWLTPSVVGLWALVCGGLSGRTLWRRRHELGSWLSTTSGWSWAAFAYALGFAGMAAYWSWFFPPELWDSLFYHLPMARILGSSELFEVYWSDPGRHGLLLRGASGANLLPMFLSGFFNVGSPVYRLAPPAVTFGFLGSCAALVDACDGPKWATLVSFVVVSTITGVVFEASGYYADLILAAYLGYVFALALRSLSTRSTRIGLFAGVEFGRLQLWLAVLCLFAALPKRSGMLVLGLPPLVALYGFVRDSSPHDLMDTVRVGAPGLLAGVMLAPYLIWYETLAPFPEQSGAPSWSALYGRLVNGGLPRLFDTNHLESIGPHVASLVVVLFVAWSFRLFRHRKRSNGLLPVWICLWGAACVYGIWRMNKLKWFNHWMRYLMPIYGVAAAWIAVSFADLSAQPPESRGDHLGHRLRRWVSRLALAGLAAGFLWLTPWTTLRTHVVERFGDLSFRPAASADAKREASKWGGSYEGWVKAAELAERTDGHILSADTRIFYMLDDDRVVYDTWSVPKSTDTVDGVMKWLNRRNVTVLIEERNRGFLQFGSADRKRSTNIGGAVLSERIERVDETRAHAIYRVVERSDRGRRDTQR
jgi:hypothetical protein